MTAAGNVKTSRSMVEGDMDVEGAVLRELPASLRKYLEEESPSPYRPSQVRGYLNAHGEAATLDRLRELSRDDTAKTYGREHPQVKESK